MCRRSCEWFSVAEGLQMQEDETGRAGYKEFELGHEVNGEQ